MRSASPRAILFTMLTGVLSACGDGGTSASNTTSFSLLLKDAPGDFQRAVVTIGEVDLVNSAGTHIVTQTPVTQDLLTLAASAAPVVSGANVPSGNYQELRLKLTGACIAVDNGNRGSTVYATTGYDATPCGGPATGTLIASLEQAGVKVNTQGNALELTSAEKTVLLNFDVTQSFTRVGSGWALNPVVSGVDATLTGSIHLSVQLGTGVTLIDILGQQRSLTEFTAGLVQAGDTLARIALADSGGGVFTANMLYLVPETYELSLIPPTGLTEVFTTPQMPLVVPVTSGDKLTESVTVTGAH